MIAEFTADVAAGNKGMHLVDADPVQLDRVVFDGVKRGGRLAEADRDDDVAVGGGEFQDVFGSAGLCGVHGVGRGGHENSFQLFGVGSSMENAALHPL